VRRMVDPFDHKALVYPWRHEDESMDALAATLQNAIKQEERRRSPRAQIFRRVWELAEAGPWSDPPRVDRATVPYLTEPWYC